MDSHKRMPFLYPWVQKTHVAKRSQIPTAQTKQPELHNPISIITITLSLSLCRVISEESLPSLFLSFWVSCLSNQSNDSLNPLLPWIQSKRTMTVTGVSNSAKSTALAFVYSVRKLPFLSLSESLPCPKNSRKPASPPPCKFTLPKFRLRFHQHTRELYLCCLDPLNSATKSWN